MSTKAKTKKPLKLDKKSYILFAIIGILLIAVILLIQTRFKKDMRLSDNGFAIVSGMPTLMILRPVYLKLCPCMSLRHWIIFIPKVSIII